MGVRISLDDFGQGQTSLGFLSELHALESFLTLILTHLLKLYAWPQSDASNHWRGEIVVFQAERHTVESSFRCDTTITFVNCDPVLR